MVRWLMEEGEYQSESDRLRAAEKFMVKGDGAAECSSCGFKYRPEDGDPDYPVAGGTLFADLPGDWACPICGAPPAKFKESGVVVAGFAENQGYGFGGNELTGESKLLLIYGALAFFVALFLLSCVSFFYLQQSAFASSPLACLIEEAVVQH